MWDVFFDEKAEKEIACLDPTIQNRVLKKLEYMRRLKDPREICKPLKYTYAGMYSLRVGKFRAILTLQEDKKAIIVLKVQHREDVYE